jgi:hypothetical protein
VDVGAFASWGCAGASGHWHNGASFEVPQELLRKDLQIQPK